MNPTNSLDPEDDSFSDAVTARSSARRWRRSASRWPRTSRDRHHADPEPVQRAQRDDPRRAPGGSRRCRSASRSSCCRRRCRCASRSSSSAASCTRATCSSRNDPYHGGGHLPDFNVFSPVFDADGELLLIASIQCHHGDTGGAMAGGYNVFAKDIWSEGTRYPLLKIVEAGKERRDVVLHDAGQQPARPASSATCARRWARRSSARARLSEIIADYGADTVRGGRRLDRSTTPSVASRGDRALARRHLRGRRLRRLRPGRATSDIHVHVAVTVEGDRLIVDFAGSDDRPEHPGVVDVRQHPRLLDRPARDPGGPDASRRTRASSTASTCACRRARCLNPAEGKPVSQRHAPSRRRGGRRDRDGDGADPARPVLPADLQVRQPAADVGRRDPRTGQSVLRPRR